MSKLPTQCPSCRGHLQVSKLTCPGCNMNLEGRFELHDLLRLPEDDLRFVVDFVKSSGSLKQIARQYGAEVTGVCSTTNLDMVKSIGANKVIDYTKEDFSDQTEKYDLVFDAVAKASKSKCKSILAPGGQFVSIHGYGKESNEDLEILKELLETGKIKPVIDRKYSLDEIVEAHKYVEQFHKKGNVSVTIQNKN